MLRCDTAPAPAAQPAETCRSRGHCLAWAQREMYLTTILPSVAERSMAKSASVKTRLSSKGQVVLPKAIRDKRGWGPGAELIVEERPEGVLLRRAAKAEATRVEDVFGR